MGKRGDFGDVSVQKKLRANLNCKSFDWYIKKVYPEVDIPPELADPSPSVARNETNEAEVKTPNNQTDIQVTLQSDEKVKNQPKVAEHGTEKVMKNQTAVKPNES